MRLILLIPLIFLLQACAAPSEMTESDDNVATAPEMDQSLVPGWYSDGVSGEIRDGELIGYAKTLGSTSYWVTENAETQAANNLRLWIDEQVEEARSSTEAGNSQAGEIEFIITLRNAVSGLEFGNAEVAYEEYEEEGVYHVFLRIATPAADLADQLGSHLEEYTTTWEEILRQEPLSNWISPVSSTTSTANSP